MVDTATIGNTTPAEDTSKGKVVVWMASIGESNSGGGQYEIGEPRVWPHEFGPEHPGAQWDDADEAISECLCDLRQWFADMGSGDDSVRVVDGVDGGEIAWRDHPGGATIFRCMDADGDHRYTAIWTEDAPTDDEEDN